jgi:DUF4097 and DUF4098 domain-containing protein YvlB
MKQKLFILVLMMAVSVGLQAQEKTINKSFDGVKEVNINTASGDCRIVKGSGNKVEVTLVHSYDDDVFEAIFEQDGSTLNIKEKFARNTSSHGSSDWKLMVPDNMKVKFNTGSGDLDATKLAIEIKSNTGSGDIHLDNVSGKVKVNTGSGETNVDYFDGELIVNTGSGDVDLDDSKGSFKINVGSGDIDANKLTGDFSINVGSGDIDANDLSLTDASSFNSGSGDARVVLKAELKYDISVNSGSGNATLDFDGSKIAGEVTMKANKKHGDISAPFEFDSVTEEEHGDQTIVKKTAKIGNSDIKIKVTTGSGRATIEK